MLAERGDGLDGADFLAVDDHADLQVGGLLEALGEPDRQRGDGGAVGARVGEAEAAVRPQQRLGGGGGGFRGGLGFRQRQQDHRRGLVGVVEPDRLAAAFPNDGLAGIQLDLGFEQGRPVRWRSRGGRG